MSDTPSNPFESHFENYTDRELHWIVQRHNDDFRKKIEELGAPGEASVVPERLAGKINISLAIFDGLRNELRKRVNERLDMHPEDKFQMVRACDYKESDTLTDVVEKLGDTAREIIDKGFGNHVEYGMSWGFNWADPEKNPEIFNDVQRVLNIWKAEFLGRNAPAVLECLDEQLQTARNDLENDHGVTASAGTPEKERAGK